ncbi:hypothetical protein [Mycobacterium leprae]|uniref:U1756r n=1 Tax=Mycobacterium leprae TaxID=1769 RepID=Q49965_MYCLR|nr:hypothetical protein [Mycobacterium leprae]AAA62887.1 u1756r [Mycobacterium leprae]
MPNSRIPSIMASPTQHTPYGQIYNNSLRAADIRKAGMFHLLIAVAFTMMGMVADAFTTSLTLRLHQKESSQRTEIAWPVLFF